MAVALTILYATLIFGWIYRGKFFKIEGLRPSFIAVLFAVKCLFGGLYVYVHNSLFSGGDSGLYFTDGLIIRESLFTSPAKYLMLTFGPNALENTPAFIAPEVEAMGYWHDLGHYMVVRFHAIVSLFSMGHIAIHVMAMALLSTIGLLLLYKALLLFRKPDRLMQICLFGVPSILFWISGMHKEGLLVFLLSLAIYQLAKMLTKGFQLNNIILLLLALVLTFLVRDYVGYLLAPTLLLVPLYYKYPKQAIWVSAGILAIVLVSGPVMQALGLPNYIDVVTLKFHEFQSLAMGVSHLEITEPTVTFGGLLLHIPIAFLNAIASPFEFIATAHYWYWPIIIDNVLWLFLVGILLKSTDWKQLKTNALALPLLIFSTGWLIVIGLIVPNMGAIIRYRSIAFLIVLFGLLLVVRPKASQAQ